MPSSPFTPLDYEPSHSFSHMSSRHPRFQAALEAYYTAVAPGERTCQETGTAFQINERDFTFYRSLGMPLPTTAPRTRLRRQRAMVAGFDLFRTTAVDGKPVITMFDSDCPAPVTQTEHWNSDAFDATAYARDYMLGQSFFDQWLTFSRSVPRPAMIQDPKSENSPWALYGEGLKNCYFTYQGMRNVDLEYGDFCVGASSSSDVSVVYHSSECHDCAQMNECSRAIFSEHCEESIDIAFCLSCRNCSDCFGCTNLRNKKFYFLNEQLTEQEYTRRRSEIDLSDASVVQTWKKKIREQIWDQNIRLAGAQFHAERCLGDDLVSCQDVQGVSMFQAERVYNAFGLTDCKDTIDLTLGLGLERCANLVNTWNGYENKMTINCGECIDLEYSELCTNCEHCFGCIGLERKMFCIFNKQYTEAEYWPLLDQIKTEMLTRGEYGEFFPYRASLWAYNTSHADAQFPLSEAEASALGARWYAFKQEKETEALSLEELPLKLADTSDDILTKAFRCPVTGRAFRFVKPELERHRRLNIALPRVHPTIRRKQRAAQLFWICVFPRTCSQCQKDLMSRIPTDHPSPILCETCYEAKVLS